MAILRTLITSVIAKTSNFEKGMKRSRESTSKFSAGVTGANKVLATFGVALGGAAISRFANQTLDAADKLSKLHDRLGISVERLQELHFIAGRSGVSVETMNMALQRMQRRVSEAALGTGEAVKALKELGINAQDVTKLGLADQFIKIGGALAEVGNSSDKVRLAMKLFDSEGVALLQTLTKGKKGLEELSKIGNKTAISEENINNMVRMKDAIFDLASALKMHGGNIVGFVSGAIFKGFQIPVIEDVNDKLLAQMKAADASKTNRGMLGKAKRMFQSRADVGVFTERPTPLNPNQPAAFNPQQQFRPPIVRIPPVGGEDEFKKPAMAAKDLATEIEEVNLTALQVQNTLANSFEGFITGANDAKSAVKALAQELLLLTARKAFIDPAAEAGSKFLGKLAVDLGFGPAKTG